MKYAYYPGCSLHSTAKEYDASARAVCQVLGIELVEIPEWNCCGATSAHSLSHDLSIALPLRNLMLAEQMGLDVVAPCAACYNRLKSADAAVTEDPDLQKAMAGRFGISYNGRIRVLSLLEIISDLEGDKIQIPLKCGLAGLKPACYYGCLLLRPPDVVQFDDPENPQFMDRLMAMLGAGPVDWPYKNECCGASLALTKTGVVVKLAHDILAMAKRAGANCLVTACPLCQGNLDMRQPAITAVYGERFDMPIFYFTQMMGIAYGLPDNTLGLRQLMVNPAPLLEGIGAK